MVIEGESQEEFDDFRELLIDHLSPDGPLEILLVDRIAASSWHLRQTGQLEAQIFDEMRNSLAAVRKQNSNDLFMIPLNDDNTALTYHSRFSFFQEARSAWDATEDGIACVEGRLSNDCSGHSSFYRFLKNTRILDTDILEPRPGDIVDAISNLKKRHENQPELFCKLSEMEDTYRSIAEHQFVHISSLRQYTQDIRDLIRTSNELADEYGLVLDEAIEDISSMEMDINQQLRPNLGLAVSCDLKGSDVLTRFIRYESQIQRGLFKTIHELNRLQASHQSRQTPSPIAIYIDISSEFSP